MCWGNYGFKSESLHKAIGPVDNGQNYVAKILVLIYLPRKEW